MLDACSTVTRIECIEVEVGTATLGIQPVPDQIDFVAFHGKGTPTRVASAPEHAKSPHYEIKRALHRMNAAADDMKRSPIGLASPPFGSDDDLIFRGVAADWVARILPRDRLDLMRAAAETIRLRLRAGLLGAR